MSISKEKILSVVSSYDILNHYLKTYNNGQSLQAGKNISNPFLPEKQKTPSFNIFISDNSNVCRYKDFATGDEGSCFDFVMNLFNINFAEALIKINQDLYLSLENDNTNSNTATKLFDTIQKEFSDNELNYWLKYNINKEVLKKFKVVALTSYKTTNKQGKEYTITSSIQNPIFAYILNSGYKVYKPFDSQYKFQFLGNKPNDYIFGWEQLPKTDKQIFITGGEKDVMTLNAHGYNAITLNSETAILTSQLVENLKQRFEHIIMLYDTDDTGVKYSNLNAKTYGLYKIQLPKMPNNGKDISDYFSVNGTIEEFDSLVSNTIKEPPPSPSDEDKVIYSASELLAMNIENPKFLLDKIFPQTGTAVLAGKPDIGKSQFARHLCINIAIGAEDFIDFKLFTKHKKAVYVATEDDTNACAFLLKKQSDGLNKYPTNNLHFIFADLLDQTELIEKLDTHLEDSPADLIVVDSFGDVFKGNDSNNNAAMRATVKAFNKLAHKYQCLILFVHHINKGAYTATPSQEQIQGSSGLVQKVRLAVIISDGEKDIRYLSIVKGNYCAKEFKVNAQILRFNEKTFLYSHTGQHIPINAIGGVNDRNPDKFNNLLPLAQEIFEGKILRNKDVVAKFSQITNKSTSTAKRFLREVIEFGIVEQTQDEKYKLADIDDEEN